MYVICNVFRVIEFIFPIAIFANYHDMRKRYSFFLKNIYLINFEHIKNNAWQIRGLLKKQTEASFYNIKNINKAQILFTTTINV